jgi:hypothetical protein
MKITDLIQVTKKTEDELAAFRLRVKLARYKSVVEKKEKLVRLAISEG